MAHCLVEAAIEFNFDAAHHFFHFADSHPNRRLHGHSFRAQLTVAGTPDPATGFICEFSELEAVAAQIRDQLDHRYLNEIPGLGAPSLEHLAIWIWNAARPHIANLEKVTVYRDSCKQLCSYRGLTLASNDTKKSLAGASI